MQRKVFERSSIEGFQSQSVESMNAYGQYVYLATSNGALLVNSLSDNEVNPTTEQKDNLIQHSKDKKIVKSLKIAISWKLLLCLIDNVFTAFDIQLNTFASAINESKGCSMFSINESTNTLILLNKNKLNIYVRQNKHSSNTFQFVKTVNLNDTPKLIHCISSFPSHSIASHNIISQSQSQSTTNGVIVGYKRHYEILRIDTSTTATNIHTQAHILEIEKEHKIMICLEVRVHIYEIIYIHT